MSLAKVYNSETLLLLLIAIFYNPELLQDAYFEFKKSTNKLDMNSNSMASFCLLVYLWG